MPVVIQGQDELDAGLAGVVNDFVKGCEGLFIVLACRHREKLGVKAISLCRRQAIFDVSNTNVSATPNRGSMLVC